MNSSLGSLAKEISEELKPEDLEELKDPAKLLSSGFSENGGIGKIIKSVGEKLQGKMENGKLNENKLMEEAQEMMQMFGPIMQQMMGSMGSGGLNPMSMMQQMFNDNKGGKKKKKDKKKRTHNVESVGEDIELGEKDKELIEE